MLSCGVYIFYKSNNNRFVTYPEDGSKNILIDFGGRAVDKESRICVYRRRDLPNLMYYAFVRKIGNQPVGICVVLNDAYFDDINGLFLVFERCFGELLFEGLIDLSAEGNLSISLGSISEKGASMDKMRKKVRLELGHVKINNHLPVYNLTLSGDEENWLKSTDDNRTLVQSTFQYPYTFIEKKENYESEFIDRMHKVTSTWWSWYNVLSKQKTDLEQQNAKLRQNYDALIRRQKQYGKVFFFLIVAVALGIVLYFVKNSLSDTQEILLNTRTDLEYTQRNLDESRLVSAIQRDSISSLVGENASLNRDYDSLKSAYIFKDSCLKGINNAFRDGNQSFFITHTDFDRGTGIMKFDYYGVYEDTILLTARAVNGMDIFANSQNMIVKLANNRDSIYISNELSYYQIYSFELQIDNRIVGGGRH